MAVDDKGRLLTGLARAAIRQRFGQDADALPKPGWLEEPGAVFVTLTLNGQLRGCIGSLEAHRPLADDVAANAVAAAFSDPRFPPLTPAELDHVHIEVSVLSKAEAMHVTDEQDALTQLRPGVDGIVLESGWHRATYLPQVWEQLPDPHQFLANLKVKAGLPPNYWSDTIQLARYTVAKYEEQP